MVPKLQRAAARPRCPRTPVLPGATRSGADRTAKGRRRLQSRQDQGPGAQHVQAYPGKAPGVPSEGGLAGEASSRNFPTCLSTLPISLSSSAGPSPSLCAAAADPARDTREAGGGARAAGVTCRESFQLRGAVLHPRAGPRGAASSTVRRCLSSGSRSGHCSGSCHSEGCAPARPPASNGPHPGLIGSANPRPCACSRRHLPLARPPGPRLPRPSPPRAAASPATRWDAARELSAPRGRSAFPPHLSGPGLQRPPRGLISRGCAWAPPGLDWMNGRFSTPLESV